LDYNYELQSLTVSLVKRNTSGGKPERGMLGLP
jgi:hypothetical protein